MVVESGFKSKNKVKKIFLKLKLVKIKGSDNILLIMTKFFK